LHEPVLEAWHTGKLIPVLMYLKFSYENTIYKLNRRKTAIVHCTFPADASNGAEHGI